MANMQQCVAAPVPLRCSTRLLKKPVHGVIEFVESKEVHPVKNFVSVPELSLQEDSEFKVGDILVWDCGKSPSAGKNSNFTPAKYNVKILYLSHSYAETSERFAVILKTPPTLEEDTNKTTAISADPPPSVPVKRGRPKKVQEPEESEVEIDELPDVNSSKKKKPGNNKIALRPSVSAKFAPSGKKSLFCLNRQASCASEQVIPTQSSLSHIEQPPELQESPPPYRNSREDINVETALAAFVRNNPAVLEKLLADFVNPQSPLQTPEEPRDLEPAVHETPPAVCEQVSAQPVLQSCENVQPPESEPEFVEADDIWDESDDAFETPRPTGQQQARHKPAHNANPKPAPNVSQENITIEPPLEHDHESDPMDCPSCKTFLCPGDRYDVHVGAHGCINKFFRLTMRKKAGIQYLSQYSAGGTKKNNSLNAALVKNVKEFVLHQFKGTGADKKLKSTTHLVNDLSAYCRKQQKRAMGFYDKTSATEPQNMGPKKTKKDKAPPAAALGSASGLRTPAPATLGSPSAQRTPPPVTLGSPSVVQRPVPVLASSPALTLKVPDHLPPQPTPTPWTPRVQDPAYNYKGSKLSISQRLQFRNQLTSTSNTEAGHARELFPATTSVNDFELLEGVCNDSNEPLMDYLQSNNYESAFSKPMTEICLTAQDFDGISPLNPNPAIPINNTIPNSTVNGVSYRPWAMQNNQSLESL